MSTACIQQRSARRSKWHCRMWNGGIDSIAKLTSAAWTQQGRGAVKQVAKLSMSEPADHRRLPLRSSHSLRRRGNKEMGNEKVSGP